MNPRRRDTLKLLGAKTPWTACSRRTAAHRQGGSGTHWPRHPVDAERAVGCGYDPGMLRIGLVGAGRMGAPICENLVRAGHRVGVFDIRPERADAVRAAGAEWRGS